MGIENKKFRCHGSIVLEQCAKVIAGVLFFGLVNISDIFDEGFDVKSDGLYVALAFMGILGAILIVMLTFSIIRWRKTTIVIEEDAIVWERNTLNKKTLTIGIKSISSINIERNLFEQLIGTAKLKLDTSSLSTADTTDVVFLFKYQDAVSYKEYLEEKVRAQNHGASYENAPNMEQAKAGGCTEDIVKASEEKIVAGYVSGPKEIIMHCIYDISVIGVLIGLGLTIYGIVEIVNIIRTGIASIGEFIAVAILVITFGSATVKSVVGKFFRFYNLTVFKKGNRIHMKYGMFKLKEYVIPVDKINAIHLKQTWIGRLFQRYSVSMECVGVGNEENETAQLTLSLPYNEVMSRLFHLLPEYDVHELANMKNISSKALYHKMKRIVIFTAFVFGFWVGIYIMREQLITAGEDNLAVILLVLGILLIYAFIIVGMFLQLKTEAVGFGKNHMFIATGTFGKNVMIVPYKKIQYVTLRKSPLSKYSGLMWGHLTILSGALKTVKLLPCIQEEQAELIKEKIVYTT